MIETKAIADLFVSARTATVNVKPMALRLRAEKKVYEAESLEKLQDAIASLSKAGAAMLELISQSMSPTVFIDRGDPPLPDYGVADFTKDGLWHDLDLSSIVPLGATSVLLRVFAMTPVAGRTMTFRKKGNTSEENVSMIATQAAGVPMTAAIPIIVNPSRVCQYNATAATWTWLTITVMGWWA